MKPTLAYHYDAITGAFLNTSTEADEDPMEPGNFLVPAYATLLGPPSPPNPKKQQAVFADDAWSIEDKPVAPMISKNINEAPIDGMWPRISIKEALKGGVT